MDAVISAVTQWNKKTKQKKNLAGVKWMKKNTSPRAYKMKLPSSLIGTEKQNTWKAYCPGLGHLWMLESQDFVLCFSYFSSISYWPDSVMERQLSGVGLLQQSHVNHVLALSAVGVREQGSARNTVKTAG